MRLAIPDQLVYSCLRHPDLGTAPPEALGLLEQASPDRVAAAANFHKVAPIVYSKLARTRAPEQLLRMLRQLYVAQLARHAKLSADLKWVAEVLDAADVSWATVKGPAVAELLYPQPHLRQYADLDVLVDPRAIRTVLADLVAAGATVDDRNWEMIRAEGRGQFALRTPTGSELDLHWDLVGTQAERRRFSIDSDELLSRAQRRVVTGVRVPTLDPTDAFLHLCLHLTLAGGKRLGWFVDIDRAVRLGLADPAAVVPRARDLGLTLVTAVTVSRTARLLGTPIAPQLLDELAAAKTWRYAAELGDRVFPPAGYGRRLSGEIITRSLAATSAQTLRTLTRGGMRQLSLVFTPRVSSDDGAKPLTLDRGGPNLRDRYLEEIAARATGRRARGAVTCEVKS